MIDVEEGVVDEYYFDNGKTIKRVQKTNDSVTVLLYGK